MTQNQNTPLTLRVYPHQLAICRLPADSRLPEFASTESFFSITRTPDELSLVCEMEYVPAVTDYVGPWACLSVEGVLDFSLTGILASLAEPLAANGISIFAISTFNTDYILVREGDLTIAIEVLREAGHRIVPVQ